MSPEQLKMFVDRDYMDLLYLHMYSLSNMDKLIALFDESTAAGNGEQQG